MRRLSLALIVAIVMSFYSTAAAYDGPLVVDDANFLDGVQLMELTHEVQVVNDSNDFFLVILTTPSLDGQKIETYSKAILQIWKIGHENKKDGILLLVVKEDTTFHFQPDVDVANLFSTAHYEYITDIILKPAFEKHEYLDGLVEAVHALPTGLEKANRLKLLWLALILFILILVYANTLNRKLAVCRHCSAKVSPSAVRCPSCFGDIRALRDDPCPCGSKETYGHCCLEKHLDGIASYRFQFLRRLDIRYYRQHTTSLGGFTAGGTCKLPSNKGESKEFDGTGVVGGW